MYKYEKIARLLKKGYHIALMDRATFKSLTEKNISVDKAIEEFKQNNKIKENVEIDKELFVEWVENLGFREDYIDIQEASFTCFKEKVGMTIWKYETCTSPKEEADKKMMERPQERKEQLSIAPDSLQFY